MKLTNIVFAAALGFVNVNIAETAWAACDASQPNSKPSGQYVIAGATVYDKKADLTWQRCSIGQSWRRGAGCVGVVRTMTWDEAMRTATGDWRVPTIDELRTLVSESCKSPAINEEAFPDMSSDAFWYWSSTNNGSLAAWYVDFGVGISGIGFNGRPYTDAVRLVRGGQ